MSSGSAPAWVRATFQGKKGEQDVFVNKHQYDHSAPLVEMKYQNSLKATVYKASRSSLRLSVGSGLRLSVGGKRKLAAGGSSAKASKVAKKQANKSKFLAAFSQIPPSAVVCFTDGACQGNPGHGGAGTIVKIPAGGGSAPGVPSASSSSPSRIERHVALGPKSTNNSAELTAIKVAFEIVADRSRSGQVARNQQIHICSDSAYSVGMLSKNWKAKKNIELVAEIRALVRSCRASHKVVFHHLPSHVGIAENERADALANLGVDASSRGVVGVVGNSDSDDVDMSYSTPPATEDEDDAEDDDADAEADEEDDAARLQRRLDAEMRENARLRGELEDAETRVGELERQLAASSSSPKSGAMKSKEWVTHMTSDVTTDVATAFSDQDIQFLAQVDERSPGQRAECNAILRRHGLPEIPARVRSFAQTLRALATELDRQPEAEATSSSSSATAAEASSSSSAAAAAAAAEASSSSDRAPKRRRRFAPNVPSNDSKSSSNSISGGSSNIAGGSSSTSGT